MQKHLRTLFTIVLLLATGSIGSTIIAKPLVQQHIKHSQAIWDRIDVQTYDIVLRVQPDLKRIEGSNTIGFKVLKNTRILQFDLFKELTITSINYEGSTLTPERQDKHFLIKLPHELKVGTKASVRIEYNGIPKQAVNPPWDGGFVWSKDSLGNPWVGLACEGIGASVWLPCKDHWNDEPESVHMQLQVPEGLTGVSNGRFKGSRKLGDGYEAFNWQVLNPINNYDISVNVGKYVLIQDQFMKPEQATVTLDYYVLAYNDSIARIHFQQVKRMLACFEKFFGPYPFINDGYKLVETPYWGMEHQSCVAYGNNYKNNDFGFDFIIIHESGHEWFANSITADDPADDWIHESFTTYAEALFVECQAGPKRSVAYLLTQKPKVKNEVPIIGSRGGHYHHTDNDVYYKGTWMLHTMRNLLDNDTLWFNALYDLSKTFRHQIVSSKEVEAFISKRTRHDFKALFEQYLYHTALPVFEYQIVHKNGLNELHYRLKADVKGLEIPIKVTIGKGWYGTITASPQWELIDLPYEDENEFKLLEGAYLLDVKKLESIRKD